MSIKPLDMQVAIGQIHQVAQRQHQEQMQPTVQQEQHAAHLHKDATRIHETVVETAQDHPGNNVRDALAREGKGRERERQERERKEKEQAGKRTGQGLARAGEDKGGVIDIRQ